jgi:glycosyltransferase involved in cell wall biosynthesis
VSDSSAPLRVLHVVPSYAPAYRYGGTVTAVEGLARAQAELGAEVEVVTTGADGDRELDVLSGAALRRDSVSVRYFRRRWPHRLYRAAGMRRYFAGAVAGFDLLHLHSVFLLPTALAAAAARGARVPYVLSPHGMLSGALIAARNTHAKRLWIALIERRNLRHAAGVIASSTHEIEGLRTLDLGAARMETLALGVEPRDAAPAWRGRRLLYLGRLNWKKNLASLIDAVANCGDVELLICGPDDEGLAPALRARVAAAGVAQRIEIRGAIATEEKWALIEASSALVLPSLDENFGLVVAEAMASARPVITTAGVGAAEHVQAAAAGVIAQASDAAALARAIETVLSDPEAARAMGARGQEYARRVLDWRAIAARSLALYRECGAGRGGRHAG